MSAAPNPLSAAAELIRPGKPVSLVIPRLGIHAAIAAVGRTAEGAMDDPPSWEIAAWYREGPRPGEEGNAVIAGHVDSDTGKAVFWELLQAKEGDEVEITDTHGERRRFVVRGMARIQRTDTAMAKAIFDPQSTGTHLLLITCSGGWNEAAKRYEERFVVFTDLLEEDGLL